MLKDNPGSVQKLLLIISVCGWLEWKWMATSFFKFLMCILMKSLKTDFSLLSLGEIISYFPPTALRVIIKYLGSFGRHYPKISVTVPSPPPPPPNSPCSVNPEICTRLKQQGFIFIIGVISGLMRNKN